MVWNSGQSPLYRTVESFNSASGEHERSACECGHEEPERPSAPGSTGCAEHVRCCAPARNSAGMGGFLQKLTSDRDSLLIIALMVLLWREKIDMKLIAALAFILLA